MPASSKGSAKRALISSNCCSNWRVRGHGILDIAAHVLVRVELRLLRHVADGEAVGSGGPRRRNHVSTPAMIRSSVLLPEPLRPSTPILAPG